MELNDIKKELYKQYGIMANLVKIRKGVAYYSTFVNTTPVRFEIPVSDMGESDFTPAMEAKYLIRWIKIDEKVTN